MDTMSESLVPALPKPNKTCQDLILDDITWEQMIEKLLDLFQADEVNIEEVEEVLGAYHTKVSDWKKYAKFDKFKYTRNLVHEGNGKFNLMLLCWAAGNQSSIHDHSDAHCFVKCLKGELLEVRQILSTVYDSNKTSTLIPDPLSLAGSRS